MEHRKAIKDGSVTRHWQRLEEREGEEEVNARPHYTPVSTPSPPPPRLPHRTESI